MTNTTTTSGLTLSRLSLRKAERAFLAGGTGAGKSTLEELLLLDFLDRYPNCRVVIADTKPRFRAEWEPNGVRARRRYKSWDHGPFIPDSVRVETPADLDLAWKLGHRVAIAQNETSDGDVDVAATSAVCAAFFRQARTNRPQLLCVDETLDFFPTSQSRIGRPLLRVARAGRERGMGALYCSQRTKGVPVQLISELTKLYLFLLDFDEDAERLCEAGAPRTIRPPTEPHEFVYWTKLDRRRLWGPYKVNLGPTS